MSLRYKIFLGAGLTMIAVVSLLTLHISVETLTRAADERRRIGNLIFHVVQEWIDERRPVSAAAADAETWVEFNRRLSKNDLFRSWLIVDSSSKALAWDPDLQDVEVARADPNLALAAKRQEITVSGNHVYVPLVLSEGSQVVVLRNDIRHLTVPETYITQLIKSDIGIMALGTVLLVLILYILLNALVVRPLETLSDASRAIAAGNYKIAIGLQGAVVRVREVTKEEEEREEALPPAPALEQPDELYRLVDSFNQMLRAIRSRDRNLQRKIREATDQIQETQRGLMVAQKLSATGTLAAGIAHEINNPLGGLINAARTLQKPGIAEERRQTYLKLIVDGLARIGDIVKMLLQFSPRQPNPCPVELRPVVERAVALVQHKLTKYQIRLEDALDPGLPLVFAEPQELQQVFVNLLMNAADAIGKRGGRIRVFHETRPGEVTVAVQDDGCGMEPQVLEKAFDLFFTTKPAGEGTGLGLAVVHNIVQGHGGRIELQSGKGGGTTVRVTLPIRKAPAVPPPAPPPAQAQASLQGALSPSDAAPPPAPAPAPTLAVPPQPQPPPAPPNA
ncbi:MAG: HAMP domain-containing protein [Planctomycetes bacterium]|nr:HAMP domain-containing protein [Planctomycetota bacterium]